MEDSSFLSISLDPSDAEYYLMIYSKVKNGKPLTEHETKVYQKIHEALERQISAILPSFRNRW